MTEALKGVGEAFTGGVTPTVEIATDAAAAGESVGAHSPRRPAASGVEGREGLYAEPVAVKQGWFCCWNGANQLHLSTGIIGPEHRYVKAIGSLDPTSAATARENMTQTVKTMFPGGKI
jgi:hypothetical protein